MVHDVELGSGNLEGVRQETQMHVHLAGRICYHKVAFCCREGSASRIGAVSCVVAPGARPNTCGDNSYLAENHIDS